MSPDDGGNRWEIIDVPTFNDERGELCFLEAERTLPFAFKRFYYLFSGSPDQPRGAHAHLDLQQCYIALSGSVKVKLDDGYRNETVILDAPSKGLIIRPVVWRDIELEKNSVLAVLASDYFFESDYIRNFEQFQKYVAQK